MTTQTTYENFEDENAIDVDTFEFAHGVKVPAKPNDANFQEKCAVNELNNVTVTEIPAVTAENSGGRVIASFVVHGDKLEPCEGEQKYNDSYSDFAENLSDSSEESTPKKPLVKRRKTLKTEQGQAEETAATEIIAAINLLCTQFSFKDQFTAKDLRLNIDSKTNEIKAFAKCLLCTKSYAILKPHRKFKVSNYKRHLLSAHVNQGSGKKLKQQDVKDLFQRLESGSETSTSKASTSTSSKFKPQERKKQNINILEDIRLDWAFETSNQALLSHENAPEAAGAFNSVDDLGEKVMEGGESSDGK